MSIDYSDMAFPKLACKKKGNRIKRAYSRVEKESATSVRYSMTIILSSTQRSITSCSDPASVNYPRQMGSK